ncbi:hypothetical protein [Pseudoclavibacter helvolus]|uniref:hypothetical protein n=1 Tax=Pseudoclavibacter helvolus TaxID=255205 RepID=UPI0035EFDA3B
MNKLTQLNVLAEEIHAGNRERGFWDDLIAQETFGSADAERALGVEKLALVVTEVSEAIEEVRSGHQMDETYSLREKPDKPEGVPSELADVLIRVLDFAGYYGIDIGAAVDRKLAYNATRGHKHGRVF